MSRGQHPLVAEKSDEIKQMCKEGLSYNEIARRLGLSRSSVRYLAVKKGWRDDGRRVESGTPRRKCLRCREEFQPLRRLIFICTTCKISKSYAEEVSSPW